ncbi:MAG: GDP-mannose 4,6-dehydratase [candidate division Zixibacteria bacterium]|nr:GDP-mannose 4,6-dehydratase [candidate division Zixibacteria bacterium]
MKALITGITGQDGSYLAEFLLSRGYEVHGTMRISTKDNFDNIGPIKNRLKLHRLDMLNQLSLIKLIEQIQPDEIYNLAAVTAPGKDWDMAELYAEFNGISVIRLLEATRRIKPDTRIFQASSYEMLASSDKPLTESSPSRPLTPGAAAKQFGHWIAKSYREKYGLNIWTGILFEHTSPRHDNRFITRQIAQAAAKIKLGLQENLTLDNLTLTKDWGFAGDYVRAFWMMLQHPVPDDYIIATGLEYNIEEFCQLAFDTVDLDWQDFVKIKHPNMPINKTMQIGDASHARRNLMWEPEVSFDQLVGMMVEADLERLTLKNRLSAYLIKNEQPEGSVA